MRISDWSSDVCSSDLFEQLQFHGGTLITMCCEDGRKCRCGGVFADAEPQSTVSSESNRLDRALRSLQIADDPTRIDKEGPPDLGEADAAAYAFEQLNPKFRFESRDSATDIWRVDTKPVRGTPKGEFLGSHKHRPNLNQIQRTEAHTSEL